MDEPRDVETSPPSDHGPDTPGEPPSDPHPEMPNGPFPLSAPIQHSRPLTAHRWSVGVAVGLTLLTGAITLFGGLVVGALNELAKNLGLSESSYGILAGVVLSLTYVAIIGAVWLATRRAKVGFTSAVGLRPAPLGATLGLGLGVAIGARVATGIYGAAIEALGVDLSGQEFDPTRLLPQNAWGIALTVLLAVVLAPVAEELVFRGVLLSALRDRWGDAFAIGVSSAVFAAAHVMPFAMPPIFLLSLALGWMYVRTRTLWAPIAAHALFNGIGLAALYALQGTGVL